MDGDIVALITVAAGGVTHGVVNGITMGFPSRPKWAAFLLALLVGVVAAAVATIAYLPPEAVITRQVVLIGLTGGLAAAGLSVTQASAESRRLEAGAPGGEPDPVTPEARGR